MPGRDQTGPQGTGSMTGRGLGPCGGGTQAPRDGFFGGMRGRGGQMGAGAGRGRGLGQNGGASIRTRMRRRLWDSPMQFDAASENESMQQQLSELQKQIEELKNQLLRQNREE